MTIDLDAMEQRTKECRNAPVTISAGCAQALADVLALIARVRELEKIKRNWLGAAERQKSMADTSNRYADQLKERIEKAEARVWELEAERAKAFAATGEP